MLTQLIIGMFFYLSFLGADASGRPIAIVPSSSSSRGTLRPPSEPELADSNRQGPWWKRRARLARDVATRTSRTRTIGVGRCPTLDAGSVPGVSAQHKACDRLWKVYNALLKIGSVARRTEPDTLIDGIGRETNDPSR
jgi:hypothetical protein